MDTLQTQYRQGLLARENAKREEEEKQLVTQQSKTSCSTSEQCASGFACIGGRCAQADPTGATAEGGAAGCGTGVGSGSTSGGGNGNAGCGGPAASSGAGGRSSSSVGIFGCGSASAGNCAPIRGISGSNGSGGGGGGGGYCGVTCCSCSADGCFCYDGPCPELPEECSPFCSESWSGGAPALGCNEDNSCGNCEYCGSDGECHPEIGTVDCRCGYICPGCDECGVSGNCLRKNCPVQPMPPDPPQLPEECDCNCHNDCGECQYCASSGICKADPTCVPEPTCGDWSYEIYEVREWTELDDAWETDCSGPVENTAKIPSGSSETLIASGTVNALSLIFEPDVAVSSPGCCFPTAPSEQVVIGSLWAQSCNSGVWTNLQAFYEDVVPCKCCSNMNGTTTTTTRAVLTPPA